MGDWNSNLINHYCHKAISDFLDLFPLITRPTRITANKASLLDNTVNDPLRPSISGLSFLNDISDHLHFHLFCIIIVLVIRIKEIANFFCKHFANIGPS